ncbi:MAG: hypothetical protein ACTS8H_00260 [Arsenophonus sp. NC-PE1-MAG3]
MPNSIDVLHFETSFPLYSKLRIVVLRSNPENMVKIRHHRALRSLTQLASTFDNHFPTTMTSLHLWRGAAFLTRRKKDQLA